MPRLALKIDVDTYQGLRSGVPRLLDGLGARSIPASVFVSMGPDNSGRAIRRLFTKKGFAGKMMRSNALRLYGLRTALYGTLLPAPQIARSFPDILRRVVAEGHELGVHGWDHVTWHDRLLTLGEPEVAAEVDRAVSRFREIVGADPAGFAAPGWQCSAASLVVLDRGPFRYHSSTRGTRPCRPAIGETVGRLPEIPTTLPTLDELLGLGMGIDKILDVFLSSVHKNEMNVLTVHAEVEGGIHSAFFETLLDRLRDRVRFERLIDIAGALDASALPVHPVVQATRPGRAGTVSCQAE